MELPLKNDDFVLNNGRLFCNSQVTGSVGGFLGLFLKIGLGDDFPFNGQEINIYTCILSLSCYIAGGLIYPPDEGCKLVERLEKEIAAIHASEEAVSGNTVTGYQQLAQRALGVGDAAFTPADRVLMVCIVVLGVYETICFLIPLGMWASGSEADFMLFWWVWLAINFVLAVVFSVWFSIGGIRDLGEFFERLSSATRDDTDDGTVTPGGSSGESLMMNTLPSDDTQLGGQPGSGDLKLVSDGNELAVPPLGPAGDAYAPPSLGADNITAL